MRVAVAMSGGVDSAVAAALLVREGVEVVGVTLQLADLSARGLGVSRCCSPDDVARARATADTLGIPHYVLDMEEAFSREVLGPFVDAYVAGRTPSPCIRCNSRIKFGELLRACDRLGAETLATGHYARCGIDDGGWPALWRGLDADKDQSYFLFELGREQLRRVRFPLGELRKGEVRVLAKELDLPAAGRRDSQEACFIPPGMTYRDVLERLAPDRLPAAGEIVDSDGVVLGRHGGIHRFTIGQRRGLGVAVGSRLHVVALDAESRRVVVGDVEATRRTRLVVDGMSWLVAPPTGPLRATVQVRSRHQGAAATVRATGEGRAEVRFDKPVAAPAPGQAAVVYDGDRVLGGGWITATG